MIQTLLWSVTVVLVSIVAYILSYIKFRKMIALQTKQMIALMKSENIDSVQIGDIYRQADGDFSDLERAAMSLRKKYLRLRRQSQEERLGYETVFSGLKEGIVTVDQNLRIISFNESFMNFFNWAPVKEQPNYFLQDVIRDPQIITTFKSTFEKNKIHKSEVDFFKLFVTPLPSRNENESWCLGVFYDLSEIRKTEKIRIDFVANASHEMRTPLTVIKGYSELLKQNLEAMAKTEALEFLNPILQSTDQMSDLMDELLNLSKVELGSSLVKQQLSTQEITEDVLLEVDNLLKLQNKKIQVVTSAEGVLANADALRQILRNLLINAIKYSGNSSEINIEWVAGLSSVLLKVKDNGPGISKEHQDRIFERFYRVDKGRNRDQGGFGLGLALVKHHMLNHGGSVKLVSKTISLESENNLTGSEFICEFPNNQ
jgi:two-component system, OmpR family, phosphate regulon sensor histidine kinase PhoR